MDEPPPRPPVPAPASWASPLGIIALFLTVTESVTGIAVMRATGGVQVALTAYVIALPLLVLAVFATILWVKPYVLYPPSEFGAGGATLDQFVEAMRKRYGEALERREQDEAKLYQMIQEALKGSATRTNRPDGAKLALPDPASAILAKIDDQLLTIETAPLGGAGKVRKIPYDPELTIGRLLDDLYFSIADRVGYATYGRQWILREVGTGRPFLDLGRPWAAAHGKASDDRTLAEVGILAGMRLETAPLGVPR